MMKHLMDAFIEGLPLIIVGGFWGHLHGKVVTRVDKLDREVDYLKHRHMHLLKGGNDEED